MKKLILLFVLPILMYSQSTIEATTFKNNRGVRILNKAYADTTIDTTAWLNNLQYKKLWLNLQTYDSARIVMAYQIGFDTTYIGTKTTFDSLITTSNTGNAKTLDVSSYLGGFPFIRFFLSKSGAAGSGTTTNTYTAGYKREK